MKLICICGPTATGKTRLSVELALRFNGEVISCDSMQLYRGMDIGTAKATAEEMRGVTHHLLDVLEPSEAASASLYARLADACIADVVSRGRQPILAGGTSLYMDSVIRGDGFAGDVPDPERRDALNAQAETEEGKLALMAELTLGDPERAAKLHINDKKRLVRAIEVLRDGACLSAHDSAPKKPKYEAARIVLAYADRSLLYRRIDERVDEMLRRGLVGEVRLLMRTESGSTAMQAIGYKELACHLRGECGLDEAVEHIKQASRNYAKRQLTWLRRYTDALWINVDEQPDFGHVIDISTDYLRKKNVECM